MSNETLEQLLQNAELERAKMLVCATLIDAFECRVSGPSMRAAMMWVMTVEDDDDTIDELKRLGELGRFCRSLSSQMESIVGEGGTD
jgi:hypothetical protein